ncbi:MAG: hypothetical protein JW889_14855 [Verrucomicrobia bacterium]|nr:hypothetical protein [Verrucomicrobiota bacterium]
MGVSALLTGPGRDSGLPGSYAEGRLGDLIVLVCSSGFLGIAVDRGNTRQTINIDEGGEFILQVL